MYKNWKDLIEPEKVELERDPNRENYGKFTVKPLERGFGLTMGNSLRRVLLSSLQGAAITKVKIKGVEHEFSTIRGVAEDVSDIILNLKGVRIKCHSEGPEAITIKASGQGDVTAKDILTNDNIEILNPEHHIASLDENGKLEAEMTVKMGRGYVTSEENKDEDDEIGAISIDSAFSPIKRVNYNVTQARVGKKTDFDKLTLEVWTNGAVAPEDAVAYAAKIIKEQVQVFINFDEKTAEPEVVEVIEEEVPNKINEHLLRKVEELELSVRSANCLQNADLKFIGELVQKTEMDMLKTKNFGRKSLNEIKEILTEMGLGLGMKLDLETVKEIEKLRRNNSAVGQVSAALGESVV
ncbi:DNA-directed RNA polymerase subunit alpha [bacterium]|nr:DNA-directed RNA polymerase subunit alpha [bacterium]